MTVTCLGTLAIVGVLPPVELAALATHQVGSEHGSGENDRFGGP